MPWSVAAAAIVAGGAVYSSNKASKSAKEAAEASVEGQDEALQYQQSVEELPLAYRDASMGALGGEYGLTMDENGNVISDGSNINDRVMNSQMYTGALEQGENAIGRNASAIGRLRGGSTASELGFNAQSAYQNAYQNQLQGLGSFANQNLNTNSIAGTMAGIGNTQAAGITAGSQIQQQGYTNAANAIGAGLNAYGTNNQKPVV